MASAVSTGRDAPTERTMSAHGLASRRSPRARVARHRIPLIVVTSLPLAVGCESTTSPGDPDPFSTATVVYAEQDLATLGWSLYRVAAVGGTPRVFEHPRTGVGEDLSDLILQQPRFSPDGERIIYRTTGTNTDDWYLVMVDSGGESRRVLTPRGGFMDLAEWSPRGDRILYHHGGISGAALGVLVQTALVDTLGNRTDFFVAEEGVVFEGREVYFSLSPDPNAGLYDAQWDADGDHLILVGFLDNPVSEGVTPEQVELFRVRVSDGALVGRVSNNAIDEAGFVLSPDGGRVLLSRGEGAERRLLVGTLPALATRELDTPIHEALPRWAPDGRHAVFSSAGGIHLVDTVDGDVRLVTSAGAGSTWPDMFCPACG